MKRKIGGFILVALVSALSLGSAPVFAQAQDQGFYAGVNFGQSKVKDVCLPGLTVCDDTDTALSIFGGYQFNRHFAVEIAYTDLGKVTFSGPGGTANVESTGLEFLAVGIIPISQQFALYGKLGFFMWEADVTATFIAPSDDGTDITFAIGARYNFTKNFAAQLQWQRYMDVGGADIDVLGAGVLFRF